MVFAFLRHMSNPHYGGNIAKTQSWEVSDAFWKKLNL